MENREQLRINGVILGWVTFRLADALLVRGIRTEDIMSPTRRQAHALTPFAKVQGIAITYPAEASESMQKKPPAKRSRTQSVAKTIPKKKVKP